MKYRNITIIELANILKKFFPSVEIEITERKFEDVRSYCADSSKAEKYFNFKPQTTIEHEVTKMEKIFQEHRIKNVDDDIYYNVKYVKELLNNRELSKR